MTTTTQARTPKPPTKTKTTLTHPVRHHRWGQPVTAVTGTGLIILVIGTMIIPSPELTTLAAATLLAGATGAAWAYRANRRSAETAAIANRAMARYDAPLIVVRTVWTRLGWPGQLRRLHLRYPAGTDNMVPAQIVSAISHAVGERRAKLIRHRPRRREVAIRIEQPGPEPDKTPADTERQRIEDVVDDTLGTVGKVADYRPNDDNTEIVEFTVKLHKAARFTVESVSNRLTAAITKRLDGRWRTHFDLQTDQVTFRRRQPLPRMVPRPVIPITADLETKFPQAVNEDGEIQWWHTSGAMAHMLRCGRTRTGKTVASIGDAVEAARRDWQVFVLDPKRIEFLGLRGWPNVVNVATAIEELMALIVYLYSVMEERYRLIEEEGKTDADFHHILVVIDEYRQLYGMIRAWWAANKVTGMPSECPALEMVGGLLRMAAAARIHILMCTQRPDAEFLKGEALALDTPIPTPTGWTTMADLTPGDHVLNEHGQPIRVSATTTIQTGRPCYQITFSDDTTVVADADHLWQATRADTTDPQIVTTSELATTHLHTYWSIPTTAPLDLPDRDLPLDPQLLGHWLGNHTADQQTEPALTTALGTLGIHSQKQIPHPYLRASHAQRAALLTGLLDRTDYRQPSRQRTFTHDNRRLISQTAELIASLGHIPTITRTHPATPPSESPNHEPAVTWIVAFDPDRQTAQRTIVDITPVASVPVRCITVESATSLYLATHAFIPTHNCRDNFSARSATGRLSPDGAGMMFEDMRTGTTIPRNIQGRGTLVGLDDKPQEVQYFYTPDPRKASTKEERELLAQLTPEKTTWPPLRCVFPNEVDLEMAAARAGKKQSTAWDRISNARYEPADPATSNTPSTTETNDEPAIDSLDNTDEESIAYSKPQDLAATTVKTGDLIKLDDHWVSVAEHPDIDGDDVEITWRDDDDHPGLLRTPADDRIQVRRPNEPQHNDPHVMSEPGGARYHPTTNWPPREPRTEGDRPR